MKVNPNKPIVTKRYSTWKTVLIVIVMLFMTINTLPNFYPERPVLEISSEEIFDAGLDSIQIHKALENNNIKVRAVNINNDQMRITLFDEQNVPAIKRIVSSKIEGVTFQLETEDTRPKWLVPLSNKPIKLGLDLSGGVLFVLKVDSDMAFKERMNNIRLFIISQFNSNSVRQVDMSLDNLNRLKLRSINTINWKLITNELEKTFPELTILHTDKNALSLFYSEKARKQFHQESMSQSMSTLRSRIAELGITEAVTLRQGASRIRIELPGLKDPEKAKRIIGTTASLEFYQLQNKGGKKIESNTGEVILVNPIPIFTGQNIENARSGMDEMGLPLVNLSLDSIGGKKMLQFSAKNIGKPMITVLTEYTTNDVGKISKTKRVISFATIQSQLGSRFSITNLASNQHAQELAISLRAGSLAAPITIEKQQTIGATLGEKNISNGLSALMLGLALTLLFMIGWYRKLGLIANVSLLLNLICLVGLMSFLPGVVLTLPGIAGLVLTIGMAVDTNVIIFERIKEERRRGRSLPAAIEFGYKNALATILDANITTLVTALILFSIGYGPVKGFAITLGLGILTSMFTGIYISRALTHYFYCSSPVITSKIGNNL